jgi:hypothetical protein
VIFLAADVGFTLYNPNRLTSTLPFCTLHIISGDVQVQTKDALTWGKAEDGMMLEPGSRVRTPADSNASLVFSQGTTTKLEADTDLIVAKLEGNQDNQPDTVVLKQRTGKLWNQVAKSPDNDSHFQIQTPSADVKVYGTLFLTEVDKSGETLIKTTEGNVSVSAQGQEVQVPAGQQTRVETGAAPSAPAPIPPARNELVFTIGQPAVGLIRDPSGSSTGYPLSGLPLNQISGSQSSSPDSAYQTIHIPEPRAGEYTFTLHGIADGKTSFRIEGFAEGINTFLYTESCNITTINEEVLKLHVDVLDGLLQGATVLNLESPEGKAMATTLLKSATEESAGTSSPPKSTDSDKKKSVTTKKEETSGQEESGFHFGSGYTTGHWVGITSIFALLAVIFTVVWRKI